MNKTAIVTGSTSGIGLGIARALAAADYAVVVNSFSDNDEDRAITAEVAKAGGKAVYRQADMSKPDECRDLVAWTAKELGSVDVLINNVRTW